MKNDKDERVAQELREKMLKPPRVRVAAAAAARWRKRCLRSVSVTSFCLQDRTGVQDYQTASLRSEAAASLGYGSQSESCECLNGTVDSRMSTAFMHMIPGSSLLVWYIAVVG